MDLYAENILDHFRHPRGKKRLQKPSVSREEIHHSCGDSLTVDLTIDSGVIRDVGWDGTGCAISQAAMSMLADDLVGKLEDDIRQMTSKDILSILAVPIGPRRMKCAHLALHALKNALRQMRNEPPQSWSETLSA